MITNVKAYAKVNLALNILGTENGFHVLDTLVITIDLYDKIILKSRKDKLISVMFKGQQDSCKIVGEKSNAYKACKLFMETFNTNGADIEIVQNIPSGSGLGGSSADICGVLLGMKKLYKIDCDPTSICNTLGSDCAFMLEGGYARLKGKGEVVERLQTDKELFLVLLYGESGVTSANCYKKFDELNCKGTVSDIDCLIQAIENEDLENIKSNCQNALYEPAIALDQSVLTRMEDLKSLSPIATFMSGSGATVCALFPNEEFCRWAKSKLIKKYDRVDVLSTKIKNSLFFL